MLLLIGMESFAFWYVFWFVGSFEIIEITADTSVTDKQKKSKLNFSGTKIQLNETVVRSLVGWLLASIELRHIWVASCVSGCQHIHCKIDWRAFDKRLFELSHDLRTDAQFFFFFIWSIDLLNDDDWTGFYVSVCICKLWSYQSINCTLYVHEPFHVLMLF